MIEAGGVEVGVGIAWYATEGPRCHGRARSFAEDFRVEEWVSETGAEERPLPGYYPLYRVEKRGIDTMHMAREISRELRSRVSYGGMKDSRAVATQYVTPTSVRSARPERITKQRFTAELVGYVPEPLTRGSVIGNRFEITLRDCCEEIGQRVEEALQAARERKVPNYFGLQRFGAGGAGTHVVGKAMVGRDFEQAVRVLIGGPADLSDGQANDEVQLGKGQDVEKAVAREASDHPGDWVRALRAVPVRLRRLYIQAFQSYIFNRALSLALAAGEDISCYHGGDNWAEVSKGGLVTSAARSAKEPPKGEAAPLMQLVGYAYRNYGSRFDGYVEQALESEGVTPRQFFIEEMQEVSAEGGFRRPHLAVADVTWKADGGTAKLGFTLARGQYATVLIREILKPVDPARAGLV